MDGAIVTSARAVFSKAAGVILVLVVCLGIFVPARAAEDRTTASENFTITYSTDSGDRNAPDLVDSDGDGDPDVVERVLLAFEEARTFELDVLGYRPPPNDGDYPLYLAAASGTAFTRPLPGGVGESRPSYTVIPPYTVRQALPDHEVASFAAHEYMHAIQNGYDTGEDPWIKEATAAWVEDVYLDDVNPNHFMVGAFVRDPREALDSTTGLHEYGAFLFLQFLTERYGGGSVEGIPLVRELWESMAVADVGGGGLSSIEALGAWLATRDITWPDAWREFLLWNRRLAHYEEGAAYRAAVRDEGWPRPLRVTEVASESCRLTTDDGTSRLPALSADYVKLRPEVSAPVGTVATFVARGPAGATGAYVIRRRDGGVTEGFLTFDERGFVSAPLPFDRSTIKNVLIGLGNAAPGSSPATIAYSLRTPGASQTAVTLSVPRFTTFGESVRVAGSVICGGEPSSFALVDIAAVDADGIESVWSVTTNAVGSYSALVTPAQHTSYSATLVDPLLSSASADPRGIQVGVRVTIATDPHVVAEARPIEVSGAISPVHEGATVVIEYRRPERGWRLGGETLVGSGGEYRSSLTFPGPGVWEVRSRVSDTGDLDHAPNVSVTELVYVRREP